MFREVFALLHKEVLLERKQQYALTGLSVYAFMLAFLVSLAFRQAQSPLVWITGYWLIMLFIAVNAVAKSFVGETAGQLLYLYQLASPEAIILAKMLYNGLLMLFLGGITLLPYVFFLGSPFDDFAIFLPGVAIGNLGLGIGLTLVSAVVARAANKATLMAVLSLPVLMPQLFLLVRVAQGNLLGSARWADLGFLAAVVGASMLLSLILFPYLWRE